jgi:hypothetical protein
MSLIWVEDTTSAPFHRYGLLLRLPQRLAGPPVRLQALPSGYLRHLDGRAAH